MGDRKGEVELANRLLIHEEVRTLRVDIKRKARRNRPDAPSAFLA